MKFAFLVLPLPDRHRRRPKAIPRQVPIRSRFYCFLKPTVLHVFREPIYIFVLFKHFFTLFANLHEPTGVRSIHKLCSTPMTMRIAMPDIFYFPNYSSLLQILRDLLVYFPNLSSLPVSGFIKTAVINN